MQKAQGQFAGEGGMKFPNFANLTDFSKLQYVNQLREELNAAEEALAAENQNQQQQNTKPPTRSSEL